MVRQPLSLSLPSQADVETRLLGLLLGRSSPIETVHAYNELADLFGLSQSQRHAGRPNTRGSAWEYLVRQAKRRLKDEGWLHDPERGLWSLTQEGSVEAQKRARRGTYTLKDLGL